MNFTVNYDNELHEKYRRWVLKKTKGKPEAIQTRMLRTLGSAVACISGIRELSFQTLSVELYFYTKDLEVRNFTRAYESQVELAAIDEDKFIRGLHKFYDDMARKIKEEDLYSEFFSFLTECEQMRLPISKPGVKTETCIVADCYDTLLLQQLEYLRPDKYDFDNVVCGRATTGELLTCPDCYPRMDIITERWHKEFEMAAGKKSAPKVQNLMKMFEDAGYPHTEDGVEAMTQADRIFTHHHASIAAFINEYTYDIVPSANPPYSCSLMPFIMLLCIPMPVDELVERLKKRARMIPPNGVLFKIIYSDTPSDDELNGKRITGCLMKEVLVNDTIFMLYKLFLGNEELCGFYNTNTGYLYSVLQETPPEYATAYTTLKLFLLHLYASVTLKEGTVTNYQISCSFAFAHGNDKGKVEKVAFGIETFAKGGKLRRTDREYAPTGSRKDDEKYVAEERSISGFIRKLGPGRSPSKEAIERAAALGYELQPDETYIRPFVRTVFKLRRRTAEGHDSVLAEAGNAEDSVQN